MPTDDDDTTTIDDIQAVEVLMNTTGAAGNDAADPSETETRPDDALPPKLSSIMLLLALPQLLAHPPTHPLYVPSLVSSLLALRTVLALGAGALTPDVECRACAGLAEVGLKVMRDGLHLISPAAAADGALAGDEGEGEDDGSNAYTYTWAHGNELEVCLSVCIPIPIPVSAI